MELKEAIKVIEALPTSNNRKIQMIEFEDGIGYKFNYRLAGEQKNSFIDIKNLKGILRHKLIY